jgi:D-alanyl-lipoteichoic acid acyltransferase DltB (MBOAT superfamily)
MNFTSPTFIAFITAVVLLTSALRTPGARSAILFGANLVFLGSYVDRVSQVTPFLAFLLMSWLIIEGVRRNRASWTLWAGLAAVIASFVVLKKFSFLGESLTLPFSYLIVGLSYVLFRVLHLMIDMRQGEFSQPIAPLHFFNYTCNFLTFTAGPIQRYSDYASNASRPLVLDQDRVFHAFARLIRGFMKVGVFSAIFKYLFDNMSFRLLNPALATSLPLFCGLVIVSALFYTVYLYANFAGYMDIIIGVGALMGQDLPENFNRPFLARSFLDFWSRWHMTLSDWFKTYVFNPLLKVLATRFTSAIAAPYLGVVAFFVTFLVMGVWHGTTAVFVVYGLLMGAGASVNKLWQVVMTKRLGKKGYKLLAEKMAFIYLSRGLTFAYFALALSCLWLDMSQLLLLTSRLGIVGVLACYVGLVIAAGLGFLVWDTLTTQVAPLRHKVSNISGGVIARNLTLAFQILLTVTVASFFHKAPEFVYRAF